MLEKTILFIGILFTFNSVAAQDKATMSEIKTLSESFHAEDKTDEGVHLNKMTIDFASDTIYIYHVKGFPEDGLLDEYHYFMKINQIESIEYKETSLMGITNCLLSFSAKADKESFIFKYGTKEEIMQTLGQEVPGEGELQSYVTIALPDIPDKSKYKNLESLLKNMISN